MGSQQSACGWAECRWQAEAAAGQLLVVALHLASQY
jgi:hypothetical protein